MDIITQLLLLCVFVALLIMLSYMKTGKKKKVIFFGDSITDQGTSRGGYIGQIEAIVKSDVANVDYQLVGAGIGGNTVTDLRFRLDRDVLSKEPYITVVYIGINDVWHNPNAGDEKYIASFEESYRHIIRELLRHGSRIILCTPTVIGEQISGYNGQDRDLDLYAAIVRKLSLEYSLRLVDLRKAFMDYYAEANHENLSSGILTTDGVHLNNQGNTVVADAIWTVLKQIQ